MKTIFGAIAASCVLAVTAFPVAATELGGPADQVDDRIVVVNHSTASVRVFIEDTDGRRHPLGDVDQGQAQTFVTPADISRRGDFRVVVRPSHYSQFSRDQVSIKTETLSVGDDEIVILWLDRELTPSNVEVRAG